MNDCNLVDFVETLAVIVEPISVAIVVFCSAVRMSRGVFQISLRKISKKIWSELLTFTGGVVACTAEFGKAIYVEIKMGKSKSRKKAAALLAAQHVAQNASGPPQKSAAQRNAEKLHSMIQNAPTGMRREEIIAGNMTQGAADGVNNGGVNNTSSSASNTRENSSSATCSHLSRDKNSSSAAPRLHHSEHQNVARGENAPSLGINSGTPAPNQFSTPALHRPTTAVDEHMLVSQVTRSDTQDSVAVQQLVSRVRASRKQKQQLEEQAITSDDPRKVLLADTLEQLPQSRRNAGSNLFPPSEIHQSGGHTMIGGATNTMIVQSKGCINTINTSSTAGAPDVDQLKGAPSLQQNESSLQQHRTVSSSVDYSVFERSTGVAPPTAPAVEYHLFSFMSPPPDKKRENGDSKKIPAEIQHPPPLMQGHLVPQQTKIISLTDNIPVTGIASSPPERSGARGAKGKPLTGGATSSKDTGHHLDQYWGSSTLGRLEKNMSNDNNSTMFGKGACAPADCLYDDTKDDRI